MYFIQMNTEWLQTLFTQLYDLPVSGKITDN